MCVHVSCWCWFAVVFRIEQIDHILLYVLICKMIQNQQIEYSSYMGWSTDRIFQLHGVPALLAPANLLYRFDCNEWHTSQSINYEWMNLFPNVQMIFWKLRLDSFFSKVIIYHSFCANLSFDWLWTILSVGVHMGRHISEHYCLNQAWIKHTFTPTEGETYSKLQLFLFTSSVSIALYAFVRGEVVFV